MKIQCPHCKTKYKVQENHIGKSAKCKKCSYTFRISSTAPQQQPVEAFVKPVAVVSSISEDEAKQKIESYPAETRKYGGLRRRGYFLTMLGSAPFAIIFVRLFSGRLFSGSPLSQEDYLMVALVLLFLWIVLTIGRLRNIGRVGWSSLLLVVPSLLFGAGFVGRESGVVSFVLLCYCTIVPEGYYDKQKLDTVGWVLLAILIFFITITIIAAVIFADYPP